MPVVSQRCTVYGLNPQSETMGINPSSAVITITIRVPEGDIRTIHLLVKSLYSLTLIGLSPA